MEGMTPEMMSMLLEGGGTQPLAMQRQKLLIDRLREAGQMDQGRMVSGHYVGGGALNGILQGAKHLLGEYKASQAEDKLGQMQRDHDVEQGKRRAGYLDALTMGMRRNYPAPSSPQGWLAPDGMEDR